MDNAATTPLRREVIDEIIPFLEEHYGNPSSIHSFGRIVRAKIEKGRKLIAGLLHCSPSEIYFTSSGTEANNMIIKQSVKDLGVKHVISSKIEHHCVLHCVEEVGKLNDVKVHYVDLKENGHVDMNSLENILSSLDGPALVTLMHANNEIGNLIDLKELSDLCRKHTAYLHSDTVQTMGHYPFDLSKLDIDFLSGSAHKFHGPKGAGMMYIKGDLKLNALIHGGAQERNMRAGTENSYGIIGLIKAFELAHEEMEEDITYIKGLRKYMIDKLRKEIKGVSFNGDPEGRSLYTVLNVSFPPGKDNDMLLFNLDIAGIAVSSGSACSSGSSVGSHVLSGIKSDSERVSARFSFSRYNNEEEVDFVVEQLKKCF
jgi:cysteine desulfurase